MLGHNPISTTPLSTLSKVVVITIVKKLYKKPSGGKSVSSYRYHREEIYDKQPSNNKLILENNEAILAVIKIFVLTQN